MYAAMWGLTEAQTELAKEVVPRMLRDSPGPADRQGHYNSHRDTTSIHSRLAHTNCAFYR